MKGDLRHFPRLIFQLERELVSFFEIDFSERDADDLVCRMVQVSDFKRRRSEAFVPADSTEELLDWDHEPSTCDEEAAEEMSSPDPADVPMFLTTLMMRGPKGVHTKLHHSNKTAPFGPTNHNMSTGIGIRYLALAHG